MTTVTVIMILITRTIIIIITYKKNNHNSHTNNNNNNINSNKVQILNFKFPTLAFDWIKSSKPSDLKTGATSFLRPCKKIKTNFKSGQRKL